MKLPNIYTLTTKTENDVPLTAIFFDIAVLATEINTLIFENIEIREIFRDAFNGFFDEISSEDICTMENPIMVYLESKYRLINKESKGEGIPTEYSDDIPKEFIEEEFHNGMLFISEDGNHFMDVTCHIPVIRGDNCLNYIQA